MISHKINTFFYSYTIVVILLTWMIMIIVELDFNLLLKNIYNNKPFSIRLVVTHKYVGPFTKCPIKSWHFCFLPFFDIHSCSAPGLHIHWISRENKNLTHNKIFSFQEPHCIVLFLTDHKRYTNYIFQYWQTVNPTV